ncbi:aminotransferase class V-fold PLP-dependent enzyme [Pontivivens ytuae]|uniref:Aminotransferase class V-fold PLP-dependent enzyme n=1 Tax=Pontivivens ytuae TaxID=2789856 RepID=A0A7S9LNG6_9RHOB|nr:aminotransferase class V-fold PLP-dependent enzyme [Pontivivens ytuae]QPH52254.1 aminotransferase class V-fold PLP-dependent enzyme [Pontivivens ytuae]
MNDHQAFRAGFTALSAGILLNAAGGAPLSTRAASEGARYFSEMREEGDAPFGRWLAEVDAIRARVARMIGADAADIAFLGSASHALNLAAAYSRPGAHVVSLEGEFPSVAQPFLARGCTVDFVPLAPDARPDIDAMAAAIRPETAAIAVSHVQFRTGWRVDLAALGQLAKQHGLDLFVDATQSLGAVPVDVEGVALLTASTYKWLCAGYGTAITYLSPQLRARPSPVFGWRSAAEPYALRPDDITPHPSAVTAEAGHPPFAPILALGGALAHADTLGLTAIHDRIAELTEHLHSKLAEAGLTPVAPAGQSGITAIRHERAAELKGEMARKGVHITASTGCIRLSPHAFNTLHEIETSVSELSTLGAGNKS